MKRQKVHYLAYVGTTKIAFFEARDLPTGERVIERIRALPSHGFKCGRVLDLKKAVKTLSTLMAGVNRRQAAGIIPCRLVASLTQLKEYIFQSCIYFHGSPHPITMKDVREVIAQTRSVATIPLKDVIVQPVVQEFLVNDLSGVLNPLGLEALRLGVTLRLLTFDYLDYANLIKIFERCEAEIAEVIPSILSAAQAVLTPEEKQSGVILVVSSGGATHLTCYKNSVLLKTKAVAIGADTITEDLERRLNVDHADARRLKEVFGAAHRNVEFQDELIPIPASDGSPKSHLKREDFEFYLEKGLERFFSAVVKEIQALRAEFSPVNQVVITGGGVKLEGFLDRLKDEIPSQFRVGTPHHYVGPEEFVHDPAFAAALGGFDFSSQVYEEEFVNARPPHWFARQLESVHEWVDEYL